MPSLMTGFLLEESTGIDISKSLELDMLLFGEEKVQFRWFAVLEDVVSLLCGDFLNSNRKQPEFYNPGPPKLGASSLGNLLTVINN